MPKPLPSPELLRKLLRYEPDTGFLYWRERTPDMFKDGRDGAATTAKRWNAKCSRREAFTSPANGYRSGSIFGVKYLAHRVVWAMHYGEWPSEDIDHINHIRDDNRISNLRVVTRIENLKNQSPQKNNISGRIGVSLHHSGGWKASINHDGVYYYLGVYKKKSGAISAREKAENKLGFHENHGRT